MAALEQIRKFVARLTPEAVCDDCIAEKLALTARQRTNRLIRELAGLDGFERRKDMCSLCALEKLVIRQR